MKRTRTVQHVVTLLRAYRALTSEFSTHLSNLLRQISWEEQGVEISPSALLRLDTYSQMDIGTGTVIGPYTIVDLLSDPLVASPSPSILKIGKRVAINEFNNIRVGGGTLVIGDGCLFSQYVSVIGTGHSVHPGEFIRDQPWDMSKRGVTIGNDVWIGTHAVLLPGANVGSGSVIGAGAVVTGDLPANAIAAGVPAKVIRFRA